MCGLQGVDIYRRVQNVEGPEAGAGVLRRRGVFRVCLQARVVCVFFVCVFEGKR